MTQNKSGPWSEDEKIYIAENCEHMHYEEIANKIGRNVEKVKKYIRDTLGKPVINSVEVNAEYSIKRSPLWKDLSEQFTKDELRMFLFHWGRIISQFKDDVLPTEEMQVIDYVRLEILINRVLIQQHKNMQELMELEKELAAEKEKTIPDFSKIERCGNLISMRRMAQQQISKDHLELINKKTAILDKMKGTREARIKMLESSKETLIGWMKQIINNATYRTKLGINMEKMRLAMKTEEKRLSKLHKYSDGGKDMPLLTWQTLENEDIIEQEEFET